MDNSRQILAVFVVAVVGGYAALVSRLLPFTPMEGIFAFAAAVLGLLLIRGIWIMMKSGDARLERKKAEVMAREGRNPDDAKTYEQEIEQQAIRYLRKIPLLRRLPILQLADERE